MDLTDKLRAQPPTVDLATAERWMRHVAEQDPPSDTSEAHRLVIAELDRLRARVVELEARR